MGDVEAGAAAVEAEGELELPPFATHSGTTRDLVGAPKGMRLTKWRSIPDRSESRGRKGRGKKEELSSFFVLLRKLQRAERERRERERGERVRMEVEVVEDDMPRAVT